MEITEPMKTSRIRPTKRVTWNNLVPIFCDPPLHLRNDLLVVDPISDRVTTVDVRSLGTNGGKWGFATVLGTWEKEGCEGMEHEMAGFVFLR